MNKKNLIVLASVCLIIIFGAVIFTSKNSSQRVNLTPTPTQTQSQTVRVNIDYGNEKVTNFEQPFQKNITAFEILKNASEEDNLQLDFQQYDFGVLVKSIGNIENTKDKAWIYFVNGNSANVGADKYQLKPGDIVEWKYITPSGE